MQDIDPVLASPMGIIFAFGAVMMCYGIRLLFLGVPVLSWLRSWLPKRYSYAIAQFDGYYAVQYRAWYSPVWRCLRWVQTVPEHVHTRRTWWGKLVRTKRSWRIAWLTTDLGEAQLQLARLKARHAQRRPALVRKPAREMTTA